MSFTVIQQWVTGDLENAKRVLRKMLQQITKKILTITLHMKNDGFKTRNEKKICWSINANDALKSPAKLVATMLFPMLLEMARWLEARVKFVGTKHKRITMITENHW